MGENKVSKKVTVLVTLILMLGSSSLFAIAPVFDASDKFVNESQGHDGPEDDDRITILFEGEEVEYSEPDYPEDGVGKSLLHWVAQEGDIHVGKASWYGPGFHGKLTASGKRFNQNALTAAHRRLPLGTWVRVTNLNNDKQVVVEINDRGPYRGRRIIDLSKKAARELGMIEDGVVRVKVEVLSVPEDEDDVVTP